MIQYGFTLDQIRHMTTSQIQTYLAGAVEYHKMINGTPEPEPEPVKSIKFDSPADFNKWLAERNE